VALFINLDFVCHATIVSEQKFGLKKWNNACSLIVASSQPLIENDESPGSTNQVGICSFVAHLPWQGAQKFFCRPCEHRPY
jgi:hypothetical protein